jgi:hypothetical protein
MSNIHGNFITVPNGCELSAAAIEHSRCIIIMIVPPAEGPAVDLAVQVTLPPPGLFDFALKIALSLNKVANPTPRLFAFAQERVSLLDKPADRRDALCDGLCRVSGDNVKIGCRNHASP